MQNIIVLKPYRFVPPYLSPFWIRSLGFYLPLNLRREWGLHTLEYRGTEHLKASLAAGHSIILAPNHCRPFDPLTVGMLGGHMRQPFFTMASWHLFMEGRFKRWLIRRIGGFSIYREGVDREALKAATALLVAFYLTAQETKKPDEPRDPPKPAAKPTSPPKPKSEHGKPPYPAPKGSGWYWQD